MIVLAIAEKMRILAVSAIRWTSTKPMNTSKTMSALCRPFSWAGLAQRGRLFETMDAPKKTARKPLTREQKDRNNARKRRPEVMAKIRAAKNAFRATPKGKEKAAEYRARNLSTDKGREKKRLADLKYRQSEAGKMAQRRGGDKRRKDPRCARYQSAYKKAYNKTAKAKAYGVTYSGKRRSQKSGVEISDTEAIHLWQLKARRKRKVKCYWCEAFIGGKDFHLDHIEPLAKGGSHSIGNLCISCKPCNLRKHSKRVTEWNQLLIQPVLL